MFFLFGPAFTVVDAHVSVLDGPSTWLAARCRPRGHTRYVGDGTVLTVPQAHALPEDELNYYFNTWTDDVMNHRNVKKVFYPEGTVSTTTGLTCEYGGPVGQRRLTA